MRVLIYGAGAIGSAIGAAFSQQHDVTLIARAEHVRAVNQRGLYVHGMSMPIYWPRAAEGVVGIEAQDVIFITTKAYDTERASNEISQISGPGTTIVSLQNGLGNKETIRKKFGDRAVIGITYMGVTLEGPGKIRVAGPGKTVIGAPWDQARAKDISDIMNRSGIPTRLANNLEEEIWTKVVLNSSINPIAGIVHVENGKILSSPNLLELSRRVCCEGVSAAKANGIMLDEATIWRLVIEVLERTMTNRCSMLQDLEMGRRTEIDELNGALVKLGEGSDVPMPTNRALWSIVSAIDHFRQENLPAKN